MTKPERHFAIREIISTKQIHSQDALRVELKRRGCEVTQATLSRDMTELALSRVASAQGGYYALQMAGELQALRPLVGAEVQSIDANEAMIVVRTLPGCANTVGEYIDVQHHPDVIGTVAGDNTLLVIPSSQRKTQQVLQFLKQKLFEG